MFAREAQEATASRAMQRSNFSTSSKSQVFSAQARLRTVESALGTDRASAGELAAPVPDTGTRGAPGAADCATVFQ